MSESPITRRKVVTSLLYKFLERCGTQGVSLIIGIILARILDPHNFGIVAILVIFTNIAAVFVNAGLNNALIQKKDPDETDYSTIFFASMGIAAIAYIVLYSFAPVISVFYQMEELNNTLRVLAVILFFNSAASVQSTKAIKEMRFKGIMIVSVSVAVISGGTGIILAYNGYGVWALVIQQLVGGAVYCIALLLTFRWWPKVIFSISRFKSLFSFGWKLLVSGLLDTVYNNLRGLVIGRRFSAEALAFYDRGNRFPGMLVENLNGSIQTVLFPVFSQSQNDKIRLKSMVRRSIIMSSFIVFPAMAGLAAIAKPFVTLLLTEKWLPAVPFLMLSCIIYAFWPMHTANLNAINALGRSDIFLKLEIIKKTIGITVLLITIFCFDSALAILAGSVITTPLGVIINAFPNKKLLDYAVWEQLLDILPSLLLSLIMGGAVWCITLFGWSELLTLTSQILMGVVLYIFGAWIFKLEGFIYMTGIIKKWKER